MARVRNNGEAPGIDGVAFEQLERQEGGTAGWLRGVQEEYCLNTKANFEFDRVVRICRKGKRP